MAQDLNLTPKPAPGSALTGTVEPLALESTVADGAAARDFGLYVHVPFCAVRCGYCDFNTYTATELGGGANQAAYADTAITEMRLAAAPREAAGLPARAVSTVFFGGGTPTLLPASDLVKLLGAIDATWGLAPGAEVTTEANPDSVTPATLAELVDGGFTRVSFGMQSAVPHVLATLDRTHDPLRVPEAVQWAKDAGLSVSLDLIYGTPGESAGDWERSVQEVLRLQPDHVSAYALVIEQGTKMAAQVKRGQLPMPTDDDEADKYEMVAGILEQAGYDWYEISNWARTPEQRCRHNVAYWNSSDWWGIGPGAHSHIGGVRWWNVKHPRPYAAALESNSLPIAGQETLDAEQQATERLMLGMRLRDGIAIDDARLLTDLAAEGLIAADRATLGQLVLTTRGRLLADTVLHRLLG